MGSDGGTKSPFGDIYSITLLRNQKVRIKQKVQKAVPKASSKLKRNSSEGRGLTES
jgi:hypothetical protein